MSSFLEESGIRHELSSARTPQQNSVTERRNKTLKEAARSMLAKSDVSQKFRQRLLTQLVLRKTDQ